MDDLRRPDRQSLAPGEKPDPATWRQENLAKIKVWNEWDEAHPLPPDEPPQRWIEENREAIKAWDRWVEEHGLPLADLRHG
jgi:post-segregation antitoxin (ccd killing protein)